jgi:hypothetical protein
LMRSWQWVLETFWNGCRVVVGLNIGWNEVDEELAMSSRNLLEQSRCRVAVGLDLGSNEVDEELAMSSRNLLERSRCRRAVGLDLGWNEVDEKPAISSQKSTGTEKMQGIGRIRN